MSEITTDQRRQLDDLANAAGQTNQPSRPPHGHSLSTVPPMQAIGDDTPVPIGAQPVPIPRNDQEIMRKIAVEASAAAESWYYRYPVRTRETGQTSYIEGPTIKLANAVARLYGNSRVQLRVADYGDYWLFLARFSDYESGYSLERAFQQRKSQVSIKTKDYERQQDIAFQIGQSKAIRNVIVNMLGTLTDFAYEEARNSMVDRIGKDLAGWREKTLASLKDLPVDLTRVERVIGRAHKDWLAPDIARIVAMGRGIKDGMATIDETFPSLAAEASATQPAASAPADQASAVQQGAGAASSDTASAPDQSGAAAPVGGASASTGTAQQADASPTNDAAKERGRKDFRAGHSPKAVPADYRGKPEANFWLAGYQEEAAHKK
jgi:hypothetical protein